MAFLKVKTNIGRRRIWL